MSLFFMLLHFFEFLEEVSHPRNQKIQAYDTSEKRGDDPLLPNGREKSPAQIQMSYDLQISASYDQMESDGQRALQPPRPSPGLYEEIDGRGYRKYRDHKKKQRTIVYDALRMQNEQSTGAEVHRQSIYSKPNKQLEVKLCVLV